MRRIVTVLLPMLGLALLVLLGTANASAAPAATAHTTATATTAAAAVPVRPCVKLRTLPGYDFRYQGAVNYEPNGKVRYAEMLADHVYGAQLQNGCRATINHQARNMRPCVILRTLSGYTYRYQGATITEPNGKVRYNEVLADGVTGARLQPACHAMVVQQASHGAVPSWVNVLLGR